jgi:hypothetical protein
VKSEETKKKRRAGPGKKKKEAHGKRRKKPTGKEEETHGKRRRKKRRKENKLGLGPIDFLTQGPMAHLLSTPKFPSPIRIGHPKNPKPN